VEDIHWLDEASADLLASLVRPLEEMRLLIVVSHRPPSDSSAALLARIDELPNQRKILLTELDEKAVASLATERLGAPLTSLALDFVQAQAQGNPFFIEELLDSLQETGDVRLDETGSWDLAPTFVARLQAAHCLEQIDATWRLKAQIDLSAADIGLPDSIHGIVLARLDRLPEAVQLTVKTASVIGRVFEGEVLRRAHPQGLDAIELAGQLATLEARDFARVETVHPEPVYLFKHNITQEVAYQTLLDRQRRQLHQTVGETLELLQPTAVERLALHFYQSDTTDSAVLEKAVHYLDGAARRAKREYANETALTYLHRALGLAPTWTRHQDKIEVLHILGRREEERAALEALTAISDTPLVAAQLLWGEYYDAVSDYDAARDAVERALMQSRTDTDRLAEARCHSRLGLIAWRLGDYEQARKEYAAGLDALQDFDQRPSEAAEIRYGLGLIYRQQGEYGAAITEFEQTLALHRRAVNRYGEAQVLRAIGLVQKHLHNLEQALGYYTQSLELYRLIGAKAGESECLLNMAEVYSLDGAHDRAAILLESALEIQKDLSNAWWQLRILNGLGIVNMLTGQLEAALHSMQEGLELADKLGDERGRAYLLCNMGQVYGHLGKSAAAAQALDEGHALARQQQDRHLQALIQSELGMLASQQGDAAAAIAHARRAVDHLQALGLADAVSSDLATMAQAHLHLGELDSARSCVNQILTLPQAAVEKSATYPQRDYFVCYSVLRMLDGADEARALLEIAWQILQARAERLSSVETRATFLANLACNQAIVQEAARRGIGGAIAGMDP
jgi:predicted ATPase